MGVSFSNNQSACQFSCLCRVVVCCWCWNTVSKIDMCSYLSVCVCVYLFFMRVWIQKTLQRLNVVVMHWRLMGFEQKLVLTFYCSCPPRRELFNSHESLLVVVTMETRQTKRLNVSTHTHRTKRVHSYTTTWPDGHEIPCACFHFDQIWLEKRTHTKKKTLTWLKWKTSLPMCAHKNLCASKLCAKSKRKSETEVGGGASKVALAP